MTEKHFIIKLTEGLTVSGTEGRITRNSNGAQYLDAELDGWKKNEGEELYIELSHYDDETELMTNVGPLLLCFNEALGRYVTLIPPEVINVAGEWNYSIELRFNITEKTGKETQVSEISVTDSNNKFLYKTTTVTGPDKETGAPTEITVKADKNGNVVASSAVKFDSQSKGLLSYDSITSAMYSFKVIDTIIGSNEVNSYTKEAELLSAAKVLGDAILAGNTAEEAIAASKSAKESAEQAEASAVAAKVSEENAAASAESAKASAESAEQSKEEAMTQAEASAESAAIAMEKATSAAEDAKIATEKADETARNAEIVTEQAEKVTVMLGQTQENAEAAEESAKTSEDWAKQAAELFKTHSIKINTDYATVADLPEEGDSQNIYFIPNGGENENSFDEYVWVGSKNTYEKIGSTEVDLSAYVPKSGAVMTGTLAMPKIKVDKIARNNEDFIYVEPKTTFHSRVTFEKDVIYNSYLSVKEIHSLEDDIVITSDLDACGITATTIKGNIIKASSRVNTNLLQLCNSDILMYSDSYNQYVHSGAGEDNSHLVIRADSGITVCGSENTDTDIDLNVIGNIKENGQRVYSPNNHDNTKVSKSGDTMSGTLSAPTFRQSDGSKTWIDLGTGDGHYFGVSGLNGTVYRLHNMVQKSGDTMTGQLELSFNGDNEGGYYKYEARGVAVGTPTIHYNSSCKSGFYQGSWSQYDKCFVCGEGNDKAVIQYDYSNGWHLRVSNNGTETMNARWMDNSAALYDQGQRVYSPNNKPQLSDIGITTHTSGGTEGYIIANNVAIQWVKTSVSSGVQDVSISWLRSFARVPDSVVATIYNSVDNTTKEFIIKDITATGCTVRLNSAYSNGIRINVIAIGYFV